MCVDLLCTCPWVGRSERVVVTIGGGAVGLINAFAQNARYISVGHAIISPIK